MVNDKDLEKKRVIVKNNEYEGLVGFFSTSNEKNFDRDKFQDCVKWRGEQPTGNLPQSGSPPTSSQAIGNRKLAIYSLVYRDGDGSCPRFARSLPTDLILPEGAA